MGEYKAKRGPWRACNLWRMAVFIYLTIRPRPGSEDAIVAALAEQLVLYAQQMNVPRQIIDALMVVPPDRVEFLSVSELATYGIQRVDAVALEERRARSPSTASESCPTALAMIS